MLEAQKLESPFCTVARPDDDIAFAAEAIAVWGPWIGVWRRRQMESLVKVWQAVQPLAQALRRLMPPSVAKVAESKNPSFMADGHLPMEHIFGHKLVGHLEAPNLCRPISQQCISEEILATKFLAGILSKNHPKDAEDIEKLVDEEFKKAYQSRPFTASQMNAKYGVGSWRPMPLFIHEEASRKPRLIANGKCGGHNAATSEEETLYVISTAFAADACGATCRAILERFVGSCEEACQQSSAKELATQMPEWAEFGLGCEDMMDAFRQCPVAPEHQGANVIAYFSARSKSWMFVEVFDMVYGMRSSVVHFSRFPGIMLFHGPPRLCCLGWGLMLMISLGVHVRLDAARSSGKVTFEPETEPVQKICALSTHHLQLQSMTPAEASKLRGMAGAQATHLGESAD